MTLSVKMREGTCVFYPNKPHSVGSTEVGTLLPIVNKKDNGVRSRYQLDMQKFGACFQRNCVL